MTDWKAILTATVPGAHAPIIAGFAISLPDVIEKYQINTKLRQAHFFAQTCFESWYLRTTTELASGRAYEGRRDLGNTHPGDGERFRGRGLIQVTGRANYFRAGGELGQDFIAHPEKLASFPWAALSAGQHWRDHNINAAADRDDVREVTRLVNGGGNGLAERGNLLVKFKRALGHIAPDGTAI